MGNSNWFVVQTQPRAESCAHLHLTRQRYDVRHLKCMERYIKGGMVVDRIAPLFPSYIFVRLDLSVDQWWPILNTKGVQTMLLHGELPAPLPYKVAHDLFARADARGFVDLGGPRGRKRPSYRPGGKVRVTDGPFISYGGEFQELTGDERAIVLLSMFGGKVRVTLDETQIEAA